MYPHPLGTVRIQSEIARDLVTITVHPVLSNLFGWTGMKISDAQILAFGTTVKRWVAQEN